MKVSTSNVLLSILNPDRKLLSDAVRDKRNSDQNVGPSFGLIGTILAMSVGGPLIAKFIEHAFDITLFGDPDSKDPAKQRGLISSFVDSISGGASDLWSKLTGSQKTPAPAASSAPATSVAPSPMSRGSQITSNTGAPTAEVDAAIRSAALKEKIDYALLYSVLGAESTFRTSVSASTSSAQGIAQFTAGTWNYLTNKLYPELGYVPNDRNDPEKASRVASKYLNSIKETLSKFLGYDPTIGQIYLGYFMGPTGARKFLGAMQNNPNQIGAKIFPSQAKSNRNLFYADGKPITLQQTLDKLEGKVGKYYAQAGATTTVASANTGSGNGDNVSPKGSETPANQVVTAKSVPSLPKANDAQATQVVQAVTPASLPSASKVDRYTAQYSEESPTVLPSATRATSPEVTYIRDKQNRLTAIHG